jgi:protein Mpv17
MISKRCLLLLFISLTHQRSIAWTTPASLTGFTHTQSKSKSFQRGRKSIAIPGGNHVCLPKRQGQVSRYSLLYVSTGADVEAPEAQYQLLKPQQENNEEKPELELKQQVINGVFLAATFGYAVYTIFDIDHGMTRGWSGSEMVMRIPLDNWGNYESCLANQPIITKTLINVIIYLLGDWLSQTAFAGKDVLDFDLSRTLRNGFIGLCFGPLVHEYYQFSDAILPPEDGMVTRLEKIFMDQTLYLTVKCAIYISAVGVLGGEDWSIVKQRVQDKIVGVLFTAWKFWPLVHCITYGFVPARHRILWVNCVDLIWNAILASQAQAGEPESEDAALALKSAQVELNAGALIEVAADETEFPSLVVLGNHQWEGNGKEIVAEILSSNMGGNKNMTANAASVTV